MLDILGTSALIFGGCCANVFALEKILSVSSANGLLVTFCQFALTTAFAYPSQFGGTRLLKKSPVPMQKWVWIAALHFAINMLNNYAFAFDISVPVHIVLRSFGSVTTMIAGFIRGKRYSQLQVASVALLTLGVVVSALADAENKGKSLQFSMDMGSSDFAQGMAILLVAQFMSAYMGAYVEDVYAEHGGDWAGNLFYSHLLSLPLFAPLATTLRQQYDKLALTIPLDGLCQKIVFHEETKTMAVEPTLPSWIPLEACFPIESLPEGLLYLLANSLAQLACITGVNLLCAKASAVTVTIVLNVRKLVSFILSTILFGHQLSGKMIVGATIVFGAGALYGWETSVRLPQERARARATAGKNGKANGGFTPANGGAKKQKKRN